MLDQNTNYGGKTHNSTSYVKFFTYPRDKFSTNFRGEGTLSCFIKTPNPSKMNGSFVKTFNNYNNYNNFNS